MKAPTGKACAIAALVLLGLIYPLGCTGTEQASNLDALALQSTVNLRQAEEKADVSESVLPHTESGQFSQHNPTLDEALRLLADDNTDLRACVQDKYICAHFATDVNNLAENQGIRCAIVIIRFAEQNHAIIGFETVDQGMVYFEPQTDERVMPVIGKEYWQCIEPGPGLYHEKPAYNDKIVDIIVAW